MTPLIAGVTGVPARFTKNRSTITPSELAYDSCTSASVARTESSWIESTFPVYRIQSQSAFEHGVEHRSAAREQIAATVGTYQQNLPRLRPHRLGPANGSAGSYPRRSTTTTGLREEIRSMAADSGWTSRSSR